MVLNCTPYNADAIVTTSSTVKSLEIDSISQSEARQIKETEFELKFRHEKDKTIHGLVVYFETFFGVSTSHVELLNLITGDFF